MGIFINPGNTGFGASICSEIYVDKTSMIEFTNSVLDTEQRFLCVSRPRRFGKSMTAKMLAAYYSCGCDSHELFSDKNIAKKPSYSQELNKNRVIYMDIQWFRSVAKGKGKLERVVKYIQEQVIDELRQEYPDILRDYESSSLSEVLLKIYYASQEKFIVIIDEWDCLFREEKNNIELQEEYINFLRGMFKGQPAEEFIRLAYVTGILPIKKYGTQSALNNFDEYTMVNPLILAEYVGFTEKEVRQLCKKYHMNFEEAKRWYDGYRFKKVKSIYSPSSVTRAMRNEEFGNYWTETETYESLKFYIDMDMDGLKMALLQMLGGAQCQIDTGTFQNDMTNMKSRDDILTLLVHLGYLAYDGEERSVFIPNEEVRQEFVRAIKTGRRRELAKMVQASDELLNDTLNMNQEKVAQAIEAAHNAGTAPLFYNNEQALRSVVRFAYISSIDEFQTIQELPSGKGYADVVFFPKKKSSLPVILVELKWNKSAESAISQIKERKYPQILEGIGCDILLVGISYDADTKKHSCIMERYQLES